MPGNKTRLSRVVGVEAWTDTFFLTFLGNGAAIRSPAETFFFFNWQWIIIVSGFGDLYPLLRFSLLNYVLENMV